MVPEINKPTLLYSPSHLVIINHTHSLILNTHNLLSFFLQQSLPFHFTLKTLKWFFSVFFLISSLFESSLPSFSFSFSFQIKMIMSGGNRFPFTASQWQELEHQALIYKYMVSGIPIPPDLLFTIKRSVCLDSSKLFPHQHPHFAWSCFQMGLGRKTDPEPGRCRRTDGKKWRCSKEAYPDSKYCERHMHRGKNRSRKPVEVVTQRKSTSPPTVSSITRNHSNNSLLTTSSHSHLSLLMSPETQHQNHLHYPAGYHAHPNHQFLSSSTPTGIGLLPQENSTHLLLDSGGSSMTNTDFRRSVYGLKEEVDEHAFFSEPSGSMRSLSGSSMDDAWQLTPLTMNSSSSSSSTNTSKQRSLSSLHNEYSYLQLQSLCDHDIPKQQKQHQHHYLLGNDISNLGPMKMEKEEPQKTVHRFFDEWPPKNKESWLDLDNKSSNSASVSTTRLSISIPSSHDFPPIFNSRTNNDG